MTPLLQVNVTAGYGKQAVLTQVQFQVEAGERLALLGSSGSGKSTLLLTLLGLLEYRGGWAKGEVLLGGQNLLTLPQRRLREFRGKTIGLVPQSPTSALNPALPLAAHFQAAWAAHRRPDTQLLHLRIRELMQKMGLPVDPGFLRRKPGQISVGQAQRCALALALLHNPPLLIADEPTSALDPVNQADVLELLRHSTEEEGTALLFVSHDLLSVFRLCSSLTVLSKGRLTASCPLSEAANSSCPELRELVRALPVPLDVLLQHTHPLSKTGTKVPDKGTLLTLSS